MYTYLIKIKFSSDETEAWGLRVIWVWHEKH
jgi:hypothetical protein